MATISNMNSIKNEIGKQPEEVESNRPEGSRRGALAPVGAILGLMTGSTIFIFTGSITALILAPVAGIFLAILLAPMLVSQT